jgi:lysyl-tRNA synthetase class 2
MGVSAYRREGSDADTPKRRHADTTLRARKQAFEIRAAVIRALRGWFDARGFLEVQTPLLLDTPALELHIDAIPAQGGWLRTSPELHMKRLLAAGFANIYQLGPCFRRGERGDKHHPEFTMLEWYRAGADYMGILDDTQALVAHVFQSLEKTTFGISKDWKILTVSEAFQQWAGWDPVAAFDADKFNLDLVEKVEPALPRDVPVVLKDYPAAAAALSRRKPPVPGGKPGHPEVAERWELYIGGLELANAYSELTDAKEQEERFRECAEQRRALGKEVYPLDEEFLDALRAGLPPCAGIAFGVDRLVMLLAGASRIDDVLPFSAP